MYNLHSLYLLGASFLDDHHQFIKRILLGVQERERLLAQVKEDNAEISVMERHIADMGDRWALIGPQLHSALLSLVTVELQTILRQSFHNHGDGRPLLKAPTSAFTY